MARRQASLSFGRTRLQNGDGLFAAQLTLVAVGASLAIVAAARPQWGEREETVLSKGRNVVIAVDVSRSMLAQDVRPSRLERAIVDLRDLASMLDGDRAGLLAFRGGPVLLCPLTTDGAFFTKVLDGLSIDSAPRGETDLGAAVRESMKALESFDADHNAIVIVSDGEDLKGDAVKAAKEAGERGIPIFAIGIGSSEGATIPAGEKAGANVKYNSEDVVTRLDNQTLLDMAAASGGKYIPLRTFGMGKTTLGSIYKDHMRSVAAKEIEERKAARAIERFQIFLIPAIICFMAAGAISRGRAGKRRVKQGTQSPASGAKVAAAAALALAVGVAGLCGAQDAPGAYAPAEQEGIGGAAAGADAVPPGVEPKELALDSGAGAPGHQAAGGVAAKASIEKDPATIARGAARAFGAGNYREAEDAYMEAAGAARPDAAKLRAALMHNAGLAAYRDGRAKDAEAHFRGAAELDPKRADSKLGLGAALFAQTSPTNSASIRTMEDSATAFRDAMRDGVGGVADSARKNLDYVIRPIPKMREEKVVAEALEKGRDKQAQDLLGEFLGAQRANYAAAKAAMGDDSPDQIRKLEEVARRQKDAANLWIPLAPQLTQMIQGATTNQDEVAREVAKVQGMRNALMKSADELADLDPAGMSRITDAEKSALQYFVLMAPPQTLVAESLLAQSNAVLNAEGNVRSPFDDQRLSNALLKRFQEVFPQWLEQMRQNQGMGGGPSGPAGWAPLPHGSVAPGRQAAGGAQAVLPAVVGGTNEVLSIIREEDRVLIERLTDDTLILQDGIIGDAEEHGGELRESTLSDRRQSAENIAKILELLPKDQNQQQQQNQQQSQDQQQQDRQDEQSEDQQQEDPPQDSQEQQDEQDKQQDQQQDKQQDQQQEDKGQDASEAKGDDGKDEGEYENMMLKVLDREKDYEKMKEEKARKLPPLIHERDW